MELIDTHAYMWNTSIPRRCNGAGKLSGLTTEAGPGRSVAEIAPYLAHAIESFGLDRLTVGNDWAGVHFDNDVPDMDRSRVGIDAYRRALQGV